MIKFGRSILFRLKLKDLSCLERTKKARCSRMQLLTPEKR